MEDVDITNDKKVKQFFALQKRNKKTIQKYIYNLNLYCNKIEPKMTPSELIKQAVDEEKKGVHKGERIIKERFLDLMVLLDEMGYAETSKKLVITNIKTFYHVNDVETPNNFTIKIDKKDRIGVEELLTRKDIKKAYSLANQRFRAIILTQVSSSLSAVDIRNLKVKTILDEFAKCGVMELDIPAMIKVAEKNNVIIMLDGKRQKNKVFYRTFISPEAVIEILRYWETDPPGSKDDYIFRIDGNQVPESTYSKNFQRINHKLGFQDRNKDSQFRSHNLRRFFATATVEVDINFIRAELLLGHDLPKVQDSYYKVTSPEAMFESYLKILPKITILGDVKTRVVTEDRLRQLEERHKKEMKQQEKRHQAKIAEMGAKIAALEAKTEENSATITEMEKIKQLLKNSNLLKDVDLKDNDILKNL
jgi:integrase